MAIDGDHEEGEHVGATLRGVVFIVVAGLALGVLHNLIGQASRPPRGLAWVKHADEADSLEVLQDNVVSLAPTTGAVAPESSAATAPPRSLKPASVAATPSKTAAPVPATPPTPPPTVAHASALPVIPDVDRPIKLELASLKMLYDAGAVLVVDAREAAEYAEGHVPGALSLPYNDALAEPGRIERLGEAGRPIVVYCSGGACELSMDLAKLMLEHGRKRVLVYEGGYPEWEQAGYPVTRGTEPGSR